MHLIVQKDGAIVYDGALAKLIDNEIVFLKLGLHLDYALFNDHEGLDVILAGQDGVILVIVLDLQIENNVIQDVTCGLTEVFYAFNDRDEELEPEIIVLAANEVLQTLLVLRVLLNQANERGWGQHGVGVIVL